MDVPSAYFKFIIGKKGETRKRIENETKTQVRIPKQGEEGEIGTFYLFWLTDMISCIYGTWLTSWNACMYIVWI